MASLQDKVVVITGSTRGFGNALARLLVAKGAKVVISGRKQETVDRVVAELGPNTAGLACDVSVAEQVYALARFALERFGRIDVWVNNAGITPPPGGWTSRRRRRSAFSASTAWARCTARRPRWR